MRDITAATTLADLVTDHPELAPALDGRGLDYCCRGQRTLAQSCEELNLDVGEVVEALSAQRASATAATTAIVQWATMDATALVDHLEATHHRFLDRELPRVGALLDKIVQVHGERHPELSEVSRVFGALRADLEPHLVKEERVLFPMIRQLVAADELPAFHCGTLANPISVMMREHDQVGDLLAELRRLTDGYRVPQDGCATYTLCFEGLAAIEADTHLHVHKENNRLFPAVVALESQLAERVAN
ncbi:MAG: iron-sulfur cluster repair di-iron protein [Acidimicrobiia bacterium]